MHAQTYERIVNAHYELAGATRPNFGVYEQQDDADPFTSQPWEWTPRSRRRPPPQSRDVAEEVWPEEMDEEARRILALEVEAEAQPQQSALPFRLRWKRQEQSKGRCEPGAQEPEDVNVRLTKRRRPSLAGAPPRVDLIAPRSLLHRFSI